ncbi:MAG TPA: hypothetical protein VFC06_06070 [Demequina sp.]|nr:hypothetical protein [Demequina sp.]
MSAQMLEHDVVHEMDDGGVMGFDLHGHIDWLDVETFLTEMPFDYDEDGEGDFDVAWVWRWRVPGEDGSMYVYSATKAPGATPVTQILRASSWGKYCVNHPLEPATQDVPAATVFEGERIVAEELAAQALRIDPRPVVDALNGGCVYLCRECSESFNERRCAALRDAMANMEAAS